MTQPDAPRPLAIVGATVIDGWGGPPLGDATVVIEGGRAAAVVPTTTTPVPPGAEVVDLGADPIADIRNTRRIERVIARGVAHEPERLLDSMRARSAAGGARRDEQR